MLPPCANWRPREGSHRPLLSASLHLSQLCAGAIRSKNTMNILLQTILDAAVSAIAFYLIG